MKLASDKIVTCTRVQEVDGFWVYTFERTIQMGTGKVPIKEVHAFVLTDANVWRVGQTQWFKYTAVVA